MKHFAWFWWGFIGLLASIFVWSLILKTHERAACVEAGGVYLSYDWICVTGIKEIKP